MNPPMGEVADGSVVLIVGTGLIGTSIGLALRAVGAEVLLVDSDPDALRVATARGAGRPCADGDVPALVVVAVPPKAVGLVAAHYLDRFPDATVTDVASVKVAPLARVAALSSSHARFVGGHPMAGREVSGPEGARADLFEDRLWVITAAHENAASRVALVRWLAEQCGSIVIELTPDAHDRAVALTSHTPQLLAAVLAAQLADAKLDDVAVSGQGLRDATRLAASASELWTDILAGNAAEVAIIVRKIQGQLSEIADALQLAAGLRDDDPSAAAVIGPVRRALERGNEGRRRLPDKHGGAAHDYEILPVVVADRPGELGRLFATAGDAGVNLEDVRIEHTVGRLRAVVDLVVSPDSVDRLRKAIEAAGWQVRG